MLTEPFPHAAHDLPSVPTAFVAGANGVMPSRFRCNLDIWVPNQFDNRNVSPASDQLTLVATGDADAIIHPVLSRLIGGLIPDTTVKISPDARHGFLLRKHREFGADVFAFTA